MCTVEHIVRVHTLNLVPSSPAVSSSAVVSRAHIPNANISMAGVRATLSSAINIRLRGVFSSQGGEGVSELTPSVFLVLLCPMLIACNNIHTSLFFRVFLRF